ncbi:efflux RND transporter periplasmic adaptor subunit [Chlorobium ferrooxidans]|uniref:Secretion protein HlyD n=1 Tax=Chlorobium ferrooxidans DSM 13031 TaxID=377431 RepID=Q0YR91_9CHLB|nr:efflux RND transporter periplasmic adaptor subunit [Chlorobium ferrooxidans]EAT58818.1 Secretion protein HlyD [Chlorobium ferrooxidans DSM 13031]
MKNRVIQRFFRFQIVIAFSIPLLFAGCGGRDGEKKGTPALPVMRVTPGDAAVTTSYSSLLEGKVNVEIRPQVDGTLSRIYVDEGAWVKAGQPLFKIDDRLYREQYNSALASQHAAEASLVVAKLNEEKLVPLVKNSVVSDIQLKTARASRQAAQASVEQARAAARSAQVNVDYSTVKAPVSGYIGRIPFRMGSLVTKNQSQSLTQLSDVSEIYAYFSMSEIDFMQFRNRYPGSTIQEKLRQVAPVSLVMADGTVFGSKGAVDTISGEFDQATGSVRIRAVFPNPEGLLRSGNTGKVVLESIYHNVLLVPQAATVELQDKVFVFLLGSGNRVKKQAITVTGKSGNNYIVGSGLKAGETIVTAGTEKLPDGTVIKPLSAAPAAAAAKE